MTKLASENAQLRARILFLEKKAAEAARRESAEKQLLEMATDPRTPYEMRPVDIEDFLSKRAELESVDPSVAKTALKMATSRSFSPAGSEVEQRRPDYVRAGSNADQVFSDWLLEFSGA